MEVLKMKDLSFLISVVSVLVLVPFANVSAVIEEESTLVEEHVLAPPGYAEQGLALTETEYYTATHTTLHRYDTNWNHLGSKVITIPLVNHLGAIDYHDGYIWGGFLQGPTGTLQSIIAKIRASDFEIVQTWNITSDLLWIDPVAFDGQYLWVGDSSGIFRYELVGDNLVSAGQFVYPGAMGFSQGIRVVGNKLYTIHTFGSMDGLYEFDIPDPLTGALNQPTRHWEIEETISHLEGFAFIPGVPDQIWNAQFSQVNRYILGGIGKEHKPQNDEENVPMDTNLSWEADADANSYDVYLGTNQQDVTDANTTITLNVYKGNVDTNSYGPCSLQYYNTIYYWRVDDVNGEDTWKGSVWNFTTRTDPGNASNPDPCDTETQVPLTSALSWTPGDMAASHRIYFGTDEAAVTDAVYPLGDVDSNGVVDFYDLKVVCDWWLQDPTDLDPYPDISCEGNVDVLDFALIANDWQQDACDIDVYQGTQDADSNSYDPPGDFTGGIYYYWRIDEVNQCEVWKGDVWQFRAYYRTR